MTRTLLVLPVTVFVAFIAIGSTRAADNPHVEPATCPSCHTQTPTDADGRAGNYFLLKGTIDDTCETCHPYTCCDIGSLHEKEHNHPSNIRNWDRSAASGPRTLPLFDGYITCATCHFHRADQGSAYKLVRIVASDEKTHDWTQLCHDCHEDY